MMPKGLLFIIEGGEGSGKTELRKRLTTMRNLYYGAYPTWEPGATKLGASLREILLHNPEPIDDKAELLLFLADRADHLAKEIIPWLNEGRIIICDRLNASTWAYQVRGRQVITPEEFEFLDKFTLGDLAADLTILLDLDPQIGLLRNLKDQGKNRTRFDSETLDFHNRVRQGFLELAKKEPDKWLVLDAAKTPEEILELAWKKVEPILST
ncbi:MAG: dTMP kinase [bacterium]